MEIGEVNIRSTVSINLRLIYTYILFILQTTPSKNIHIKDIYLHLVFESVVKFLFIEVNLKYVCRISSIRSLVSFNVYLSFNPVLLAFKQLSPSDSTDLSEARFSFPDSQNDYEDTYSEKSNNL